MESADKDRQPHRVPTGTTPTDTTPTDTTLNGPSLFKASSGSSEVDRHSAVRFGPFELDLVTAQLCKHHRAVRLPPQPLKLLCVLVSHPGRLIGREELRHQLWDRKTFVDFEQGLNFCIRRIRAALGDDAEKPRYIETVPRRGYRFIAPVDKVPESSELIGGTHHPGEKVLGTTPAADQGPKRPNFRIFALLVVLAVVVLTAAFLFLANQHRSPSAAQTSIPSPRAKVVPLISLPGEERMPAFSPDGSRVAFVWSAPDARKSGIYILVVGSQSLLRLTDNAKDYGPVWTPDGRFIAFLREANGEFSVVEVAALGGVQSTIHTGVTNAIGQGYSQGSSLSISPDGTVAFTEMNSATQTDSIQLLLADGSSPRFITSPPTNYADRFPVFSPDGRYLAFVRSSGPNYVDELFVLSLPNGQTRQLTFDHHRIFGPPTFTGDGRAVVYSTNRAGLESLWRIPVTGGVPQEVTGAGPGTLYPSISPAGKYLAYERNEDEENIWRLELSDRTHARSHAQVLVPAGNTDNFLPQFSPDGRKIAFQSNRSGYSEIWVCDPDGSNLAQVTNVQSLTGSPRWSPDGRYIAFDTRRDQHSEIDVVQFPSGQSHRLISFPDADAVVPSWSRNGRWVYFASNRGGRLMHIWKVAVQDGVADYRSAAQVTKMVSYAAFEAFDGRLLFYADPPRPGIWTASPDGNRETALWKGPGPDQWSNWALSQEGMYFLGPAQPGPAIEFLDFKTQLVSHIGKLERQAFYGFALAPDGESLIYSQQDHNEREILIMSPFQ